MSGEVRPLFKSLVERYKIYLVRVGPSLTHLADAGSLSVLASRKGTEMKDYRSAVGSAATSTPAGPSRLKRWIIAVQRVGRRAWALVRSAAIWFWARVMVPRTPAPAAEPRGPWVTVLGTADPHAAGFDFLRPNDVMRPVGRVSSGASDLAPRLRALLAGLGPAPGAVANALRAAGIRADHDESGAAPIASYLSAVVSADPGVKTVSCDGLAVTVTHVTARTVSVAFPPAVVTFARAFEHGCYPELERPAARPPALERPAQRVQQSGGSGSTC